MWRGIQIRFGGVRDVRRTRIWRVGGVCVGRVIVRGRDADYYPNVESEVRSRLCIVVSWPRGGTILQSEVGVGVWAESALAA